MPKFTITLLSAERFQVNLPDGGHTPSVFIDSPLFFKWENESYMAVSPYFGGKEYAITRIDLCNVPIAN